MKFYGDFHTHTIYSDGFFGSIDGNVSVGVVQGLSEVAITDHSFLNPFGMTRRKFRRQEKMIDVAKRKYSDIRILHGLEADMITTDGAIDVPKDILPRLDVLIMGYHPYTLMTPSNHFKIHTNARLNYFGIRPSKATVDRNTKMFIRCLERNPIDILAHINDKFQVNVREVCQACCDNGVWVELNCKHIDIVQEVIGDILATNAKLVINSDAHDKRNVGNFKRMVSFLESIGIDESRIVNASPGAVLRREYK